MLGVGPGQPGHTRFRAAGAGEGTPKGGSLLSFQRPVLLAFVSGRKPDFLLRQLSLWPCGAVPVRVVGHAPPQPVLLP